MPRHIYSITSGVFDIFAAESFLTEDDLQDLVAVHPELLAGEEMTPDAPRRWLLIGREVGIPDREDSSNRWAVDHIFVDQDAIPTFVEAKRASNPEIRRAIIGQMLEYATHTRYWKTGHLRALYEQANPGHEGTSAIRELKQIDGDPDLDGFWAEVDEHLHARRIRLIFLADQLPEPLVQVIQFLNEEIPGIEVVGVEVQQFVGESGRTLVPSVRGKSASRPRAGSATTITRDRFLSALPAPIAPAAMRLLDAAQRAGASFEWGSTGVSVRARSPLWAQPLTVAWLYSGSTGWAKTRDFSFGSGAIDYPNLPEPLRDVLTRYCASVTALPYSMDASSQGVRAAYVSRTDVAGHVGELEALLVGAITELRGTI